MDANIKIRNVINEELKGLANAGSPDRLVEESVIIETSDMLRVMVEAIYTGIDQVSYKQLPFSKEELTESIEALFNARIAYVSNSKILFSDRKPAHPRDIKYPSIFGPVLEMIARFEDLGRGIRITPMLDPAKCKDSIVVLPKCFNTVMDFLELKGMFMSRGLPMIKVTSDPGIYKLTIVSDTLYGCDSIIPDPCVVMSRILLTMNYLATIFGLASVRYGALSIFQSGLNQIVWRMISMPKNVAVTA